MAMIKTKYILKEEAGEGFDTSSARATKKKSRILYLQRIMAQLAKAIETANTHGDTATAEALQTRLEELRAMIDAQEREDSLDISSISNPLSDNSEKDKQQNPKDKENDHKYSVEEIIELLKPLQGQDRSDAAKAVQDILGGKSISEALTPMPSKMLMELSDDEFNDMTNNILDEIDKVNSLPFVDEQDRKVRINKINDIKNHAAAVNHELEMEDNMHIQADQQVLRAREREKNKYDNFKPIENFELDLWRAIKDQVEAYEETIETPLRINKQYDGEDIIKPGEKTEDREREEKPSIDFYFDMSGSWTSDQEAIKIGKRAVKSIKEFEDRGELTLNVYYFSDDVTTSMDDPCLGNGTSAWKEIINHLHGSKAKNVVIMTDHDMEWYARMGSYRYIADGCVWFIWHNWAAETLPKQLTGRQGTYQYKF